MVTIAPRAATGTLDALIRVTAFTRRSTTGISDCAETHRADHSRQTKTWAQIQALRNKVPDRTIDLTPLSGEKLGRGHTFVISRYI
jgi:hypothetical protein